MSESEISPTPPTPRRRFGGYAAFVAAGILLSRFTGLIRESVFGYYLGNSPAADAFKFAVRAPNVLQNLFGEGVLSASFIPVYARLVARGDEKLAGRVAGVFVTLLALVISVMVVIGILFTPWILKITAWGWSGPIFDLTVTLVRILFVSVGLLVLSAWCLGVLNTHRMFFLSYVAPVLANIAAIATLLIFGTRLHERELAIALAWGMLVGSLLQFGVQLPFVFRVAKELSFGFEHRLEGVREMFRNFGPVVFGRGAVQISGWIDQMIATLLPYGAVSTLSYAQTIFMLPVSLFGMSVAAAELPQMASEVGTEEEVNAAIRKRLDRGLRQMAFFVVPSAVAFIVLGRIVVAALYERGRFTHDVTLIVWYTLACFSLGLMVTTLGRLYSSTFYALGDTRTPVRYALVRVGVGAALAFLLAVVLREQLASFVELIGLGIPNVRGGPAALGVLGIGLASTVATWAEYALLRRGIRNRTGYPGLPGQVSVKLWSAALVSGAIAVAFDHLIARGLAARLPFRVIVEAILVCGLFGVFYFAIGMLLGVPEAKGTLGRFGVRWP